VLEASAGKNAEDNLAVSQIHLASVGLKVNVAVKAHSELGIPRVRNIVKE
jgi:hypothetical protein